LWWWNDNFDEDISGSTKLAGNSEASGNTLGIESLETFSSPFGAGELPE
jgi:hypothetical protein